MLDLQKLHTTQMGQQRIKRNLNIDPIDAVEWCKSAIAAAQNSRLLITEQRGKNWYVYTPDIAITINIKSNTIITAHKLKTTISPLKPANYCVLKEFVYQAIFIPKGEKLPPKEIIYNPQIYIYIKDFGAQKGDLGVVAQRGGQIIGAAWTRIIAAYGHLDDNTPELAISILPEYRAKGIGTKLMQGLFSLLQENGYARTSLSVQKDNPAARFYKRLGYKIVDERADGAGHQDYLMVKELSKTK